MATPTLVEAQWATSKVQGVSRHCKSRRTPRRPSTKPSSSSARQECPLDNEILKPTKVDLGWQLGSEQTACIPANDMQGYGIALPFATPHMLQAAVNHLSSVMQDGFAQLAALCTQAEPDVQGPWLYTRNEVAERLGVGLTTLDTMRQDPAFPCIHLTDAKDRGSVRFDMAEVMDYLRRKDAIRKAMAM